MYVLHIIVDRDRSESPGEQVATDLGLYQTGSGREIPVRMSDEPEVGMSMSSS
jgi:hypothetical protein